VGLSVMFGAMDEEGRAIETESSITTTTKLCHRIKDADVEIAGLYPNVETVLPGTRLARTLKGHGVELEWYDPPQTPLFDEFEEGWIGFNFATLWSGRFAQDAHPLIDPIRKASQSIAALGAAYW
jgi:hypothetical protein